jgi:hypothetical protein
MSASRSRTASLALLLAGWALLYFLLLRGVRLNADEGFYLASSRALWDGLLPYRDYAYTQTPLLPLVQAPFLALLPGSLGGIRLLSFLWTGIALVAAHRMVPARAGALPVLLGFGLLFLCLDTMGYLSIGKTYALANLALLACALPLFMDLSWRTRLVLLSAAGVLAVGVRLTTAPSVAALWAGLWILHRKEARAAWMLGIPAVMALAVLGPFAAADPVRFVFFNWSFHSQSYVPRHPAGFWEAALVYAPGAWVLFAAALWAGRRRLTPSAVLLVASVAGVAANLIVAGTYLEYVTPFVMPGVVGALGVLAESLGRRPAIAVLSLAALAAVISCRVPARTTCVEDAAGAAGFLASRTAPGDRVLASMPEVAVEAGRPLFRNLVMGKFTVTGDLPPAQAVRYGFIPIGELIGCAERREPAAVVFSSLRSGNFLYSLPSEIQFAGIRDRFIGELLRGYEVAYSNPTFVVLLPRPRRLDSPPPAPPEL